MLVSAGGRGIFHVFRVLNVLFKVKDFTMATFIVIFCFIGILFHYNILKIKISDYCPSLAV